MSSLIKIPNSLFVRETSSTFPGLTEKELPRYIPVSDFERFKLYDLEDGQQYEFNLSQLVDHVRLFGFISGYQKRTYKEQYPVNIEAAELMALLHDKLKDIGCEGNSLELYLVRLVFLLFADDTAIFDERVFFTITSTSQLKKMELTLPQHLHNSPRYSTRPKKSTSATSTKASMPSHM
nr:type IIL restriction-modification enzyme MmeI [Segetibacter koreensis]